MNILTTYEAEQLTPAYIAALKELHLRVEMLSSEELLRLLDHLQRWWIE